MSPQKAKKPASESPGLLSRIIDGGLRFVEKAQWANGEYEELKATVRSILLYTDALIHLDAGDWERAGESWEAACAFAPELRKRFKYVGVLIEKARLAATDKITGLPAGEMVEAKLRDLLSVDKPWGILYVAVDELDEYYRRYGHVEGDSALKTIARFLQRQVGIESLLELFELFLALVPEHLLGVGCRRNGWRVL